MQKLAPHHHSGKLIHGRHTSYASLVFLVMFVGMILMAVSQRADAQLVWPDPVEDDLSVHATVPGPDPGKPAIRTPSSGQVVSQIPTNVAGSCSKDTLVKVFKNDIFAGASLCQANGSFSFDIDLLAGPNSLTAIAYNLADKAGPISDPVNVTYNVPGIQNNQAPGVLDPIKTPLNQILLHSVNYHKGIYPGRELIWPIEIIGGTAPYAVSIGWGDGKTDLFSRGVPGKFEAKHTYEKAGNGYRGSQNVVVKVTDSTGASAYLQMAVVINDGSLRVLDMTGKLSLAWPLFIVAVLMLLSFFLGERREKLMLIKKFGIQA